MKIIEIQSLEDSGARVYSRLSEAQLRQMDEQGLFIAESPKVIRRAMEHGWEAVSFMCERRNIEGDAKDILAMAGDVEVYTADEPVLRKLTGFPLTRGVLCAMRRRTLPTVEEVCRGARRIVVIDGVVDAANVGAMFRSAAALGIDGVLMTPTSCDPLNRRSVRVSMGGVFQVPWTWLREPVKSLGEYGFRTAAMALEDRSVSIDDRALAEEPRLAIVMGNEGDGLPQGTIDDADYVVRIPMWNGVDSLNVAAAAAIAMWELRATF